MANKYERPFLKQVIVRIDCIAPFREHNKPLPKKLTGPILKLFPILEQKVFTIHELEIKLGETPVTKQAQGTDWYFYGKEREKHVCIGVGHMYIAYDRYDSFDSLKGEFLRTAEVLLDTYKEIQVNRLGLRYINNIELNSNDVFEWSVYLNKNLLSIFSMLEPRDKSIICRAFHNLTMNYGEFTLKFQYGMHNPDYPAPIRKKLFTLDLDAFSHGPQSVDEIRENLDRFHEKIEDLFENCISDELRTTMGVNKIGKR
jgi:uncharacterized protein (TIGR04255 family)